LFVYIIGLLTPSCIALLHRVVSSGSHACSSAGLDELKAAFAESDQDGVSRRHKHLSHFQLPHLVRGLVKMVCKHCGGVISGNSHRQSGNQHLKSCPGMNDPPLPPLYDKMKPEQTLRDAKEYIRRKMASITMAKEWMGVVILDLYSGNGVHGMIIWIVFQFMVNMGVNTVLIQIECNVPPGSHDSTKKNGHHVFHCNIFGFEAKEIESLIKKWPSAYWCIIASPPCTWWSNANTTGDHSDATRDLARAYISKIGDFKHHLSKLKAKFIGTVMENPDSRRLNAEFNDPDSALKINGLNLTYKTIVHYCCMGGLSWKPTAFFSDFDMGEHHFQSKICDARDQCRLCKASFQGRHFPWERITQILVRYMIPFPVSFQVGVSLATRFYSRSLFNTNATSRGSARLNAAFRTEVPLNQGKPLNGKKVKKQFVYPEEGPRQFWVEGVIRYCEELRCLSIDWIDGSSSDLELSELDQLVLLS